MSRTSHANLAILYELTLSIGQTLDLADTCQSFLESLVSQLELEHAAIWLHYHHVFASHKRQGKAPLGATCLCARPTAQSPSDFLPDDPDTLRALLAESPALLEASTPVFKALTPASCHDDPESRLLVLSLGTVGFLTICTIRPEGPIGAEMLSHLQPVLTKLTTALEGCLAHRQLQVEIMARRQAEEVVRSSEERYRLLAENATDLISLHDLEGRFLYASVSSERILGVRWEELIGTSPLWVVSDSERGHWQRLLKLAQRGRPFTHRVQVRHAQGHAIWVEISGRGVRDSERDPVTKVLAVTRDVTDQVEAEQQGEALKTFYEGVLDNMPAEVVVFSADGVYQYANPKAIPNPETRSWIIGHNNAEYCEYRGLPLSVADNRNRTIEEARRTRETLLMEESFNTPEGAKHFLRMISPVVNEAGQVEQLIGYGLNITERKQAEERLKYRLELEELMVSLSTMLVRSSSQTIDEDIEGVLGLVSQSLEASRSYVFQYTDTAGILRNTHEWCTPQSAPLLAFRQAIPQSALTPWIYALENNEALLNPFLTQDLPPTFSWLGGPPPPSLVVVPLRDGENLTGFLGIEAMEVSQPWSSDIVLLMRLVGDAIVNALHRKAVESKLQRSQRQLQLAVEAAALGMWDWDPATDEVQWNAQWALMLGLSPDTVRPHVSTWRDLVHPDDLEPTLDLLQANVDGLTPYYAAEYRLRKADGTYLWVADRGNVVEWDQEGNPLRAMGIVQDISASKEYQLQLRKAKKEAERSAQVQQQFLATMSHEIRTPLNAVIGMTDLLQDSPLNAHQTKYLNAIAYSANNLLALINDILDFTKIESGKIEFERASFYLSEVLEGLQGMFMLKAQERGLTLTLDAHEDVPDRLEGDRVRLDQILINLVGNALKFTEEGEVSVYVEPVTSLEDEILLQIEVTDTGIGIPQDRADSIFNSFTQASSDTTRKYGGTGLGLAIVRELVERQGGQIEVESTPGEGSTFRFTLPFVISTDEPRPTSATQGLDPEASANVLKGVRVLVVEDNEFNQMVADGMLRRWGATVSFANDGFEGVEQARTTRYDIILMDIRMPGMDGMEATRKIRRTRGPNQHVPILALTASVLSERRDAALAAGMDEFVTKPFVPQTLLRRMVEALPADILTSSSGDGATPASAPEDSDPSVAETPQFNLEMLEQSTYGNQELMHRMLELFLSLMPEHLALLHQHLVDNDEQGLSFVAHKMRSSVQMLGAVALSEQLQELETTVRTDPTVSAAMLASRVQEIQAQGARLVAEVQAFYEELPTS